jgi:ribosome-binding protein aMBF1 (putative translation factor)
MMTTTHTVSKRMKDGSTKKYTYQIASDYHTKKQKQERAQKRLLKPQDISSDLVQEIKDAHARFGVSIAKLARIYRLSRSSVFQVLNNESTESCDKMPDLHEPDHSSHNRSSIDYMCALQTAT